MITFVRPFETIGVYRVRAKLGDIEAEARFLVGLESTGKESVSKKSPGTSRRKARVSPAS